MTKVVTMVVKVEVWVDESEGLQKTLTNVMNDMCYSKLEEYGGCYLMDAYESPIIDEETYDVRHRHNLIQSVNDYFGR